MTSNGIDAENFSGSVVGSRDVENTRKKYFSITGTMILKLKYTVFWGSAF